MKKLVKVRSRRVANALDGCNRALLELKRSCDELEKFDFLETESLVLKLMRLSTIMEEFFQEQEHPHPSFPTTPLPPSDKEQLLNFYFEIRSFQNIYELVDEHYIIYGDYTSDGHFILHLQCMDPSANLDLYLKKSRCSVFFSATFLPIHYYREQLAGREDDYAIYAPSPFSPDKRLLMIGKDVSTKYNLRTLAMYQKIATYIRNFISAKKGNYLVFFPSYRMMQEVEQELELVPSETPIQLFSQKISMKEQERESFLEHFQENPAQTTVGLCVMGGVFGEGIDLKNSRLIGAVIVGTGLPMVCTENELFREYFDKEKGTGFSYAYQYPGMNKVLQAAGRVIRTTDDIGAILLLDERFLQNSYQQLFPREWFPHHVVTIDSMKETLEQFWSENT